MNESRKGYVDWNTTRRHKWPRAKHSAYKSEQILDPEKGFELVADWDLNYIRDKEDKNA